MRSGRSISARRAHFLKYLNRLVENRIKDEADRWNAKKRKATEVPLNGGGSSGLQSPLNLKDPAAATPSKIISLQQDLALLERAMDLLAEQSKEYRDLIVAVKIEGQTYREITQETGQSDDAVRMQVKRAMLALTKIYRKLDGET